MTRVPGPSLDQLDTLADDYAGLVAEALVKSARDVNVAGAPSPEDVGPGMRVAWALRVDQALLPALGVAYEVGAATIRVGLREAAGSAVLVAGSGAVLVEPADKFGTHGGNSTLTAEEGAEDGGTDSAQPGGD